jgi:hypothetical protein
LVLKSDLVSIFIQIGKSISGRERFKDKVDGSIEICNVWLICDIDEVCLFGEGNFEDHLDKYLLYRCFSKSV